jgi:hypothetical protein
MCICCASLCHTKGELYIRRLQKPTGPNLLDKPWKDFIVKPVCPIRPCKPRAYRDHDSQWKCTTSAECKTSISAVLMVTSGLWPLWNRWSLLNCNMLMFCYSFFILPDHMLILGLKTTWCYSYAGTHSCYFPHIRKGTRLIDSGIVRLMINQSVWSCSEGYTRCSELSFHCVIL